MVLNSLSKITNSKSGYNVKQIWEFKTPLVALKNDSFSLAYIVHSVLKVTTPYFMDNPRLHKGVLRVKSETRYMGVTKGRREA